MVSTDSIQTNRNIFKSGSLPLVDGIEASVFRFAALAVAPLTFGEPPSSIVATVTGELGDTSLTDIWISSENPAKTVSWSHAVRVDHGKESGGGGRPISELLDGIAISSTRQSIAVVTALCWIPLDSGLRLAIGFANGDVNLYALSVPARKEARTVENQILSKLLTFSPLAGAAAAAGRQQQHIRFIRLVDCGASPSGLMPRNGDGFRQLSKMTASLLMLSNRNALVEVSLELLETFLSSYNSAQSCDIMDVSFPCVKEVVAVAVLRHTDSATAASLGHTEADLLETTPADIRWLEAEAASLCGMTDLSSASSESVNPTASSGAVLTQRYHRRRQNAPSEVCNEAPTASVPPSGTCRPPWLSSRGYVVCGKDPFLSLHWLNQPHYPSSMSHVNVSAAALSPTSIPIGEVSGAIGDAFALGLSALGLNPTSMLRQAAAPSAAATTTVRGVGVQCPVISDDIGSQQPLSFVLRTPSRCFADDNRIGMSIEPCPWSPSTALVADNLGRVSLVSLPALRIFHMWKGYRESQIAWLNNSAASAGAAVLYAPRRGLLEIWDINSLTRISATEVGEGGQLVQSICGGQVLLISQRQQVFMLSGIA